MTVNAPTGSPGVTNQEALGRIAVTDRQSGMASEDAFMLAGPYTLLDQSAAEELLPLCAARGMSVIIGGAFASGILATGAVPGARLMYGPASAEIACSAYSASNPTERTAESAPLASEAWAGVAAGGAASPGGSGGATGVADRVSSAVAGAVAHKGQRKGPQPVKYLDPKTGVTWSGKGPAPAWLAAVKDRSKFLIAGADAVANGTSSASKASKAKSSTASGTGAKKAVAKKVSAKKAIAKKTAPAGKAAPANTLASGAGSTT